MHLILVRKDVNEVVCFFPACVADSKEPGLLSVQEEAWSLYTVLGECMCSLSLSLTHTHYTIHIHTIYAHLTYLCAYVHTYAHACTYILFMP